MFEKVQKLLAEQLGLAESKIKLDSKVIEDLGADSLDVVELLMTLEDETGKTIPEEEVVKLKTVGDIVSVLEKL